MKRNIGLYDSVVSVVQISKQMFELLIDFAIIIEEFTGRRYGLK
jgi:hypothetical protein